MRKIIRYGSIILETHDRRKFSSATGREAMDIRSPARKLDVQIVFEGTVRHDNNLLRITFRVVDPADGFQIWSERIETEPDLQDLSTVSERIASSLVSRIRPTNG